MKLTARLFKTCDRERQGRTALHCLCLLNELNEDHISCVHRLLVQGTSLVALDKFGNTPFHCLGMKMLLLGGTDG